ncbi:MAG: hypothetical protein HW419_4218 [Deltaproteobacteria bacterium]|nr:hypothetical protein [Deltaproteobacteria bacterium]
MLSPSILTSANTASKETSSFCPKNSLNSIAPKLLTHGFFLRQSKIQYSLQLPNAYFSRIRQRTDQPQIVWPRLIRLWRSLLHFSRIHMLIHLIRGRIRCIQCEGYCLFNFHRDFVFDALE